MTTTIEQPDFDAEAVQSELLDMSIDRVVIDQIIGSYLEELDHTTPEQAALFRSQLSSDDGRGPVLIHALEGFSDAGHAIRLAADHLKNSLDTELVASFAIDELLDYRSRRPPMTS